jgi:hypothetical protein
MVAAAVAFVPRVGSTVSPGAYRRLDAGQTVAGLHARAYERRTEDHRRNERLLRTKGERLTSGLAAAATAAGLLLLAGLLGWRLP